MFDFDAFGNSINGTSGAKSVYLWGAQSGYRTDIAGGDGGYIKAGYRYYDPTIGRFSSRDSDISQPAYVYCGGDPVNFVDPTGHDMSTTRSTGVNATIAGIGIICATLIAVGVGVVLGPEALVAAAIVGLGISIYGDVLQGIGQIGEDNSPGHDPEPYSPPGAGGGVVISTSVPIFQEDPSNGKYYPIGTTDNPSAFPPMPPGSQIEDPPQDHPK